MKRARIVSIILLLVAGLYFSIVAPSRFGYYGDQNPASSCVSGLSDNKAPIEHTVTVVGYYLSSSHNAGSNNNWGTCPYNEYKVQTFAGEFWLLAFAIGIYAYLKRSSQQNASINQ